ncbi:MAG TPA: UDP-3-O-(3-hydroxymyristoyl)glucosamine N-acyltransferase, partial [Rhodospirillaceae bacterium]|nr:UDP-3-O-(3-hydroxymyristoyl)glucosamine N-acyltransferase [Rhodospirillaceae bacterium]
MADPRFFTNHGPFTLTKLCEISGASLQEGADGSIEIKDVAALDSASAGDITFLSNMKYKNDLPETKAAACIIPESAQSLVPENVVALISDNPYKAYALIAQAFYPIKEVLAEPVHKTAVVDPSAKLGKDVVIGANTVIG